MTEVINYCRNCESCEIKKETGIGTIIYCHNFKYITDVIFDCIRFKIKDNNRNEKRMKRVIEIKSAELLKYGAELTDKVQLYISGTAMLLNCGRAYSKRFKMSDNAELLIHHTDKSVIVEKF